MSRKLAREYAFMYIYQYAFNEDISEENIEYFLEEHEIAKEQMKYFKTVISGVKSKLEDIDSKILNNLQGWTLNRIAKVDLAILRLAIYEILYMNDIPYKVSVNEAVELSKSYGDDKSKSFINGLLAKLVKPE